MKCQLKIDPPRLRFGLAWSKSILDPGGRNYVCDGYSLIERQFIRRDRACRLGRLADHLLDLTGPGGGRNMEKAAKGVIRPIEKQPSTKLTVFGYWLKTYSRVGKCKAKQMDVAYLHKATGGFTVVDAHKFNLLASIVEHDEIAQVDGYLKPVLFRNAGRVVALLMPIATGAHMPNEHPYEVQRLLKKEGSTVG